MAHPRQSQRGARGVCREIRGTSRAGPTRCSGGVPRKSWHTPGRSQRRARVCRENPGTLRGGANAVRGGCAEKFVEHPRRGQRDARGVCRLGDSRPAAQRDCAGNFLQLPRPARPRQSPEWRRLGDFRPAAQGDCAGNFLKHPARPGSAKPGVVRIGRFPPCSPGRLCRKFPATAPPGLAPRSPAGAAWRAIPAPWPGRTNAVRRGVPALGRFSPCRPERIVQEISCNSPTRRGPSGGV